MGTKRDLATVLNLAQVFFLATADEDGTPHVRPFGAVVLYEGHTWFCTGKGKAVLAQMMKNAKVEIAAMVPEQEPCWVRVKGLALCEENEGAKKAMLESRPQLKELYAGRLDQFVMFRLVGAIANIYNMAGEAIEELTV